MHNEEFIEVITNIRTNKIPANYTRTVQVEKKGTLSNLFKAYTRMDDSYSGTNSENVDHELILFIERCNQAYIIYKVIQCTFSILLNGNARKF